MGPPGIYSWNCVDRWFFAFDGNGSFWLAAGSYSWPISKDCSHDNRLYKRWSWMLSLSLSLSLSREIRLFGDGTKFCPVGRRIRRSTVRQSAVRQSAVVAAYLYLPVVCTSTLLHTLIRRLVCRCSRPPATPTDQPANESLTLLYLLLRCGMLLITGWPV